MTHIGTEAGKAKPGFFRRNAVVVAAAVVVTIVTTATALTGEAQRAALDAQRRTIAGAQEQLDSARAARTDQVDQDVLASWGVSPSRIADDASIVTRMARTAFSWDSGMAYEAARAELKARYGLSEDEQFLQQFMPPARFNEDASGKRYYYIDAEGMNSELAGTPELHVISASAGQYTYAARIDVSATSDAVSQNQAVPARVKARRTLLLYITIDATGKVSALSGLPTGGPSRHSR
jgi:hypothetical protein